MAKKRARLTREQRQALKDLRDDVPVAMQRLTIRGRPIIVDSARSMVEFTGGDLGEHEAGEYYFWTAYGEDEYDDWKITGRARTELSPADRFTRIEREMCTDPDPKSRAVYRVLWTRLTTIKGLRASSYREITDWIRTHADDCKFLKLPAVILGKSFDKLEDRV